MNSKPKEKFEPVVRLIEYFGGQIPTAEALKVKQGTVSGWLNCVHGVNSFNAMRAEAITKGAIKADELCPKLAEINDQTEQTEHA